jgi:hypothetical protein
MRIFFKTALLLLFATLILLPGVVLFTISDHSPLAKPALPVTPEVAREVKRKAQEMQFAIYYLRLHTMSFSEDEMAKLFAVAARAIPRLSGDARMTAQGSEIRATFQLPENPFGDYINLRLGLPAASQGLTFDYLNIGSLSLSGKSAYALIEGVANLAFGGDEGTTLLKTIKQVRSIHGRLIVTYQPTPHIDEKVAAALQRLQPWRDEMTTTDVAAIRRHYMQLCNSHQRTAAIPLAAPLSNTLALAATHATSMEEAAAENRAALLALAIFFGTDRFNTVINAIDNNTLKRCQWQAPVVTLAGRKDLAMHFLYSAAIKILADSQTSFAVGELKEMMDSLQGGSGFSFADLAADQSGIRFAELASAPQSALRLQHVAAELQNERRFFPDISELPEAIPQQLFEQRYGGTGGDYYNQQLDEIRRRIDVLALYQHTSP